MKLFGMFKKKTTSTSNIEDTMKTVEDLQYILSLYESSYKMAVAVEDRTNSEMLKWKIQDTKMKLLRLQEARV